MPPAITDTPPYAVVFKTHFWDEFAERQLQRLRRQAGTADLFVLVDETKHAWPGITHGRVVRMTAQTSHEAGFLIHPAARVFWYNTDYQLYHFIDEFPRFDYIVTVEYDCVVNIPIAPIVAAMAARDLDFVGEPIRTPPLEWHWGKAAQTYYPDAPPIAGRLLCFAAFSRRFALQLKAARLEHARRFRDQEIAPAASGNIPWPNNEAFVGAEITRLGAREAALAEFGDISCYDWAPARPEPLLPSLAACAFIHPLLDVPRFIRALHSGKLRLEDIFDETTPLGRITAPCDPEPLIRGMVHFFLRNGDLPALERLRGYAAARGAGKSPFNVARGKPATQSSTGAHSLHASPAADAAGAVNGFIGGGYGFHTDTDAPPWWCVDLEIPCPVREIRVYNRLDVPARARTLVVAGSNDMLSWSVLYEHKMTFDFGGADGQPLEIQFPEPVAIRFLRLQVRVTDVLHLDEVEVFV